MDERHSADLLRIAFIGAGRIADLHALAYRHNPDAGIFAVCDTDAGWAARRAEEWGAERTYTDYREALGACLFNVGLIPVNIWA